MVHVTGQVAGARVLGGHGPWRYGRNVVPLMVVMVRRDCGLRGGRVVIASDVQAKRFQRSGLDCRRLERLLLAVLLFLLP